MKKTFKELTENIDMVLFNNAIQITGDFELQAGKEFYLYSDLYSEKDFENLKENGYIEEDKIYTDESDEFIDIYQYFAIYKSDGEYLSSKTDMPLYYSSDCDLYIIGIDFLDNWNNVSYEI